MCVQVHPLTCGCPVVPAPFVEDAALVSLCCLCSLTKDQLLIFIGSNVGLFLLFIDLFVCSFFSPRDHTVLIPVALWPAMNLGRVNFFFPFNTGLASLSLLPLQVNFGISLSIFMK